MTDNSQAVDNDDEKVFRLPYNFERTDIDKAYSDRLSDDGMRLLNNAFRIIRENYTEVKMAEAQALATMAQACFTGALFASVDAHLADLL